MTSSTLDALQDESSVFIDANIFVYHFTAASASCRRLLARCAAGSIRGLTSLPVLLEVAQHDFLTSLAVRRETGLLTLDALIVAVMRRLRLAHLASADHGFRAVGGLSLLEPNDLR